MIKETDLLGNFYKKNIVSLLPSQYTEKEYNIGYRVLNAITFQITNNKDLTLNHKKEKLNQIDKTNLKELIIETVEVLKSYKLTTTPIRFRDFATVPVEQMFYNYKIKDDNEDGVFLNTFKNIKIFSTGKLKFGFQEGNRDRNGMYSLSSFEETIMDRNKCYFVLSFMDRIDVNNKTNESRVFLDCYMGNSYLK